MIGWVKLGKGGILGNWMSCCECGWSGGGMMCGVVEKLVGWCMGVVVFVGGMVLVECGGMVKWWVGKWEKVGKVGFDVMVFGWVDCYVMFVVNMLSFCFVVIFVFGFFWG